MAFLRSSVMVIPANAEIDVFGLQRRNNAAEVHWLQGVIELKLFCNRCPQVNVETNILIALLKFERNKRRIGRNNQCFISGVKKPQKPGSVQPVKL